MKNIMLLSLIAFTSAISFAYPSQFKLVAPSKITKVGNVLKLEVQLSCANSDAIDWSQPVMSYDDSGDQVVVVGVAIAMSQCNRSSSGKVKTYTLEVDPNSLGYPIHTEFQAIEVE